MKDKIKFKEIVNIQEYEISEEEMREKKDIHKMIIINKNRLIELEINRQLMECRKIIESCNREREIVKEKKEKPTRRDMIKYIKKYGDEKYLTDNLLNKSIKQLMKQSRIKEIKKHYQCIYEENDIYN